MTIIGCQNETKLFNYVPSLLQKETEQIIFVVSQSEIGPN